MSESLPIVRFWEKPGCAGNNKQKLLLRRFGCQLEVRDLLRTRWSRDELLEFFQGLDVIDWFNMSAPAVKNGEIDPSTLSAQKAITLMLQEPLLIRRPLMQFDQYRQCGFEHGDVFDQLGFSINDGKDYQSCPVDGVYRTVRCGVSV